MLNIMYTDNIRHIDAANDTIRNLMESNTQIRNALHRLYTTANNDNNDNNRNAINGRRPINTLYSVELIAPTTTTQQAAAAMMQTFLQPIDIRPTQQQIEDATRRATYADIVRPLNTQCPISMEEFNDTDVVTIIRHCGHVYNTEHLTNWFRTNCRCPVCRFDIREHRNEYRGDNSSSFFTHRTNTFGRINE